MSDSSEEEDLSRFKESIDTTFNTLISASRGNTQSVLTKEEHKPKSERYLEVASHYNDVKVPLEMQKRIAAKVSAIIKKRIEFVDVQQNIKKRKIKGGVKLFRSSENFLSCEEATDTYTEGHNKNSKKIEKKRRHVDEDLDNMNEEEKVMAAVVSGQYIISKEETKCWKSRRKEKLYKYKSQGKSKVLTAVEQ